MAADIPAVIDNYLDAIECLPDGRIVLAASNLTGRYWNGTLWCFKDVEDAPDIEKCLTGIETSSGICDLVCINSNQVAIGTDSGCLGIYQLDNEPPLFKLIFGACEHDDCISSLDINSNSSNIVTAGADKCVKIWDLQTWSTIATYRPVHDGVIWQVACCPENPEVFLTCGQDGKILLFDTRLPKPTTVIESGPLKSEVTSVSWKPQSNSLFAAGDESGHVAIKDVKNNSTVCSWDAHRRRIFKLSFSPSQPWLATCADDTNVCVMDIEKEKPILIYKDDSHDDFIRGLTWSPGNDLVTCAWDKQVMKHVIRKMDVPC